MAEAVGLIHRGMVEGLMQYVAVAHLQSVSVSDIVSFVIWRDVRVVEGARLEVV